MPYGWMKKGQFIPAPSRDRGYGCGRSRGCYGGAYSYPYAYPPAYSYVYPYYLTPVSRYYESPYQYNPDGNMSYTINVDNASSNAGASHFGFCSCSGSAVTSSQCAPGYGAECAGRDKCRCRAVSESRGNWGCGNDANKYCTLS